MQGAELCVIFLSIDSIRALFPIQISRNQTGDLGQIDENGYLTLLGRLKEFINRGGEKIPPAQIDDVLPALKPVSQKRLHSVYPTACTVKPSTLLLSLTGP